MANHPSALKRHRQSLKRRARNRSTKSEVQTMTKRLLTATKTEATALLQALQSKLDKAGRKNVFHKRTAARKVASLMKIITSKSA